MSRSEESGFGVLSGLEARRLVAAFRRPRPGAVVAVAVPAALGVAGLWAAAEAARPDLATGEGRVLLGVLVSAPTAFFAYPLLFRAEDDALLRRLGIGARAVFAVRALRLLAAALAALLLLEIPFLATGAVPPLGPALAAALAGWGVSLFTFCDAARRLADPAGRRGVGAMLIGWDSELAAAAPLVYAPVVPVIVGALAGAAGAATPLAAPAAALLAAGLAIVAAR
ncbi:MAG TPA: hypothetical protein VFX98_09140, partial [Longimicrobiaceae bacterium]|nr:hypothetical protein [Longimicrobiaceae bacterium]